MRDVVCAYTVCVCVRALCIWCSHGKLSLWVSPFISSLITVPTGKAGQKSLSNANGLTLLHTTRTGWLAPRTLLQYTSFASVSLPPTRTTCSSDCLQGRPDSGQLILSSPRRLINTRTSSLFRSHAKQLSKLDGGDTLQAPFSSYSLFELVAHYIALSFTLSFSLEATNWSDALRGES